MNYTPTLPNTPLRFALFISRPFWPWAAVAFLLVVCAASVDTFTYYVYKQLVDLAVKYTEGTVAFGAIVMWVVAYPATVIGHQLLYRTSGFFGMQWIQRARKRAADLFFEYLSLHSMPYFHNRFAGSLGSKVWNAHGGMHGAFETVLWNYTPTFVTAIASVGLLSTVDWRLSAFAALCLTAMVVVNLFFSKKSTMLSEERATVKSRATGLIIDILTNIVAMKNFAQRPREIASVKEATTAFNHSAMRSWWYSEWVLIMNNILLGIFATSMLLGAFFLWKEGGITTGELIMVLAVVNGIMGWFTFIGSSINQFAERLGEMREGLGEVVVPHGVVDKAGAGALVVREGKISFENVTFGYGENQVFKDFSLAIPAGTRVGLVGPSGSGKTTFVSLLLRNHDIEGGTISIDGADIASVTQDSLHGVVAVVPQDPALFHRSIRDNIRYGKPDATEDEVIAAAKQAQAHDFIVETPQGYDTLVGERGVKLSGGQRQRIAIARALLKSAPVLVLDEATSSLDSESETKIQDALQELMKGKTVIAIAHRLSTIRAMDRIVVLENGAVAEEGTHDELLGKGGTYARLWAHQAGGFLKEDGKEEVVMEESVVPPEEDFAD